MSAQQKARMIKEIDLKLASLRDEYDSLHNSASESAEKRNKLNEKFRGLRDEIQQLKSERDQINDKVRELKERRNDIAAGVKEKILQISELNEKSRSVAKKRPRRSHEDLKEEVESIDWQIQTTSHTLEEDKELVGKVKELEDELSVHRKFERLRKTVNGLRTEIAELRAESQRCHQALIAQAKKSQETHAKMLAKVQEAKNAKTEADAFHKQFLDAKEKAKPIEDQIVSITREIRQLKGEIHDEEEQEKKQNENELRQTLEEKAREKLKRGEKLSWQEFQLLSEKGITTQG